MTARAVAAAASLLALTVSACTSFYEVPIETPIQPKMDVSAFQRVLIAGFLAGGSEDVDANLETVRLLRSQLRSKSGLRVIDADVLPLMEVAVEQRNEKPDAPASTPPSTAPPTPPPTSPSVPPSTPQSGDGATSGGAGTNGTNGHDQAAQAPAQPQQPSPAPPLAQPASGETHAPRIRDEKDLEPLETIFANVDYWKKIGEEFQNPLIVTGSVLFTPHARAGFVSREQEYFDTLGRRRVVPVRTYSERKGFILRPKFIFIDGRTGATLYSETFREEILYSPQQATPALSSYFELMDRLVPSFLSTLSSQKIRGSRVLLK
jgi:hypothetical protein